MINAIFEYKDQKIIIQCFSKDKFVDICKKFSTKINEGDYDKKLYISNNKPLNLDLTLNEQIDLIEIQNSQELKILVYDSENYVKVNYNYDGRNSFIIAKNEENFLEKAASKLKKPFGRLVFLFNGRNASKEDSKKNFNQLSNEQNKKDKSINLVIMDNDDDDDENNEENQENQEKQEKQENQESKIEVKNDNNKENDNEKDNENEEENKEPEKVFCVNAMNPFLIKLYLYLIFQFFIIEFLVYFGFKKDFNEKFIYSNKVTVFYFCTTAILASVPSGGCFSENDDRIKYSSIYFFLFIIVIVLFSFLLSKYIEEYNYIICTLFLFLLDFIIMEIYILIFKKYKGFIYFFICLLVNSIAIIISYYELLSKPDKKVIIIISIIALIKIIYITLFNYEVEFNFNDDEVLYAIKVFNYVLFTPGLLIIVLSILLAFLGIIIAICLIGLVLLLLYFIIKIIVDALMYGYE